jgi:hypothetical protein
MLPIIGGVICSAAQGLRLTLINPDLVGERLREGSVRAKERQGLIERLFREVGCDVTLQAIDKKSANVICDLPGETSDTLIVVLTLTLQMRGKVSSMTGAVLRCSSLSIKPSNQMFRSIRMNSWPSRGKNADCWVRHDT